MANDLSTQINKVFTEKSLILSTAESCTGGLLGGSITAVSGSSAYFNKGYITYSNQAKTEILGVKTETLEKFGAVSEQTANEMVAGLLPDCDVGVAITGVAEGQSERKPAGLVYIAVGSKHGITCEKFNFSGDRNEVRGQSVDCAMEMVLKSAELFD